MSPDYPKDLHRRIRNHYRAKLEYIFDPCSLFDDTFFTDYSTMIKVLAKHFSGEDTAPVLTINIQCKEKNCNPVFFSRINILDFSKYKTKYTLTYDYPSKNHTQASEDFP